MKAKQNKIKDKQLNNKEELSEKLKYYTKLYKLPKYLEKVTIKTINKFINLFSVFFFRY